MMRRVGRVYLPAEWLEALQGIEDRSIPSNPEQRRSVLHVLALRLLDHAEPYYGSAYARLCLPFPSDPPGRWQRHGGFTGTSGNQLRKRGPVAAWNGPRFNVQIRARLCCLALALKDVDCNALCQTVGDAARTEVRPCSKASTLKQLVS